MPAILCLQKVRLRGRGFQKIKYLLPASGGFKSIDLPMQPPLAFIVHCNMSFVRAARGRRERSKEIIMSNVEDIKQYGKEQMESATAAAGGVQKSLQAIATAYGDYSKKSLEDGNAFIEKLSGVKTLDKVLELQTEYAKSSYEAFVAESQKIGALYADMAKQSFKPFEGIIAKMTPTR